MQNQRSICVVNTVCSVTDSAPLKLHAPPVNLPVPEIVYLAKHRHDKFSKQSTKSEMKSNARTVIPRLTKIIRSRITFVSRNLR